jgi:hypothetical protein
MMEQRTLDIIRICKGGTKYCPNDLIYNGIRHYMAEECMVEPNYYTDEDVSLILWEAMSDYLDYCDKPSGFMWHLKDVMRRHDWDIYHALVVVFSAYTRIKDDNGNYVNGFDDRLHRLDKEELK